VCPIDFSEHSARALRYSMALARWHEASITAVHVDDALLAAAAIEPTVYVPRTADDELREFVKQSGGHREPITTVTVSGSVVDGILSHATAESADLIVMGTRGHSSGGRLWLGSVTDRIVRRAPCPVLTVPPGARPPLVSDLAGFDPVLCASAFSPSCRTALDLAVLMAQERDARLILLHALEVPDVQPGPLPSAVTSRFRTYTSSLRAEAHERLQQALPDDISYRCRPESRVVTGNAADAILTMAAREQAQLIVMGVQTRGALDRLLFGSTTRQVMRAAACPVLSVRAEDAAAAWDSQTGTRDERIEAVA
jgi:nucleotide-binding universal stress UspA family protein